MLYIVYSQWQNFVIGNQIMMQQEGNADPSLKLDFYIFLLIFQHKWMFLSTMQTLPLSTNEKVITEKQTFNTNC